MSTNPFSTNDKPLLRYDFSVSRSYLMVVVVSAVGQDEQEVLLGEVEVGV